MAPSSSDSWQELFDKLEKRKASLARKAANDYVNIQIQQMATASSPIIYSPNIGPGGTLISTPKNDSMMKVGDRVKFKDEFRGSAPTDLGDETFVVQCMHGHQAYVLGAREHPDVSGDRCPEHMSRWVARKTELRIVGSGKVASKTKNIKVDPSHLNKVSLKADVKKDIIAMLTQGSKASLIFDDWGLGETIEYGKGMAALFHGPPGTGKTWAAHCMAKAVGKELMTLAVGQIQSSMAGQTNKNIEAAFKAAKEGDKLLLLDEVDSFIGDRKHLGMILGSEINTLLTQIEAYEGILILTTNQIGNLDPALERRLALTVEFKNPTLEERKEIWKMLLPLKFPLAKDVSIDVLSEHKLTGGFIKNVLLHAARLAASDDEKAVKKEHFEAAIKRVRESQGKMGTRSIQAVTDYHIGGSE